MKPTRTAGEATAQRVLESACRIFATRGFRETTVAEICDAAGANVAAVNYYFRNKRNLYEQVWAHASALSEAAYPFSTARDEEGRGWLSSHIRHRVLCIFDPGPAGWFPKLLHRELADPSDMTPMLMEKYLKPRKRRMHAEVRRILGKRASALQVRCCAINILSLYAFLNMGTPARRDLFRDRQPTQRQLEAIISQMQAFAQGAVEGVLAMLDAKE